MNPAFPFLNVDKGPEFDNPGPSNVIALIVCMPDVSWFSGNGRELPNSYAKCGMLIPDIRHNIPNNRITHAIASLGFMLGMIPLLRQSFNHIIPECLAACIINNARKLALGKIR